MLLLAVTAVVVLLFAPVATAKKYSSSSAKSTPSATSSATASATSSSSATSSGSATSAGKKGGKGGNLPKTGGPAPMALLAGVTLVGSGVIALGYLRRRESS
jgi:LPXTG-motif cell wall-anchored protein